VPLKVALVATLERKGLRFLWFPNGELRYAVVLCRDRTAQKDDEQKYPLHSFCAISLY
jgi:hypothetical protein